MSELRPGLCSVTLRHLPSDRVLALAREAGLDAVEWGADVHAPPSADLAALARDTRRQGLDVASYGTYWRAGTSSLADGVTALDAAQALGCRRLRIWAGTSGSATASSSERADVVGSVRDLADRAAERGLELAFEHHDRTLADTVASTLSLLADVDQPGVGTYWQPRVGDDVATALAGLTELLPHVRAVHVFSWWPGTERLPLAERAELWTGVVDLLAGTARPIDLLLEFLPGDDEALLAGEAAQLHDWVSRPAP